jgi:hypothetical protein
MTLQLFLRCPVRFSMAILVLGGVDMSLVTLFAGSAVPRVWVVRLGTLLLPFVWACTAAIARGADDPSQARQALANLAQVKVWVGALLTGLSLVVLNIIIEFLLRAWPSRDVTLPQGRFLEFTGAQAWLVTIAVGICFFPLLVLQPGLSLSEVRRLSRSATEINGRRALSWFMVGMLAVAAVLELAIPAYGMTSATWLVFMGILNYVAYRDIFERRPDNVPQAAIDEAHQSITVTP